MDEASWPRDHHFIPPPLSPFGRRRRLSLFISFARAVVSSIRTNSGDATLAVFDLRQKKLEGRVTNQEDELLSIQIIKVEWEYSPLMLVGACECRKEYLRQRRSPATELERGSRRML